MRWVAERYARAVGVAQADERDRKTRAFPGSAGGV